MTTGWGEVESLFVRSFLDSHDEKGPLEENIDTWNIGQGDVKTMPPDLELGRQ